MRIVFVGTVELSYKALKKLLNMEVCIVGVSTKQHSKFNSDFVDITPLSKEHNIPYNIIDDINSSQSVEWIANSHQ